VVSCKNQNRVARAIPSTCWGVPVTLDGGYLGQPFRFPWLLNRTLHPSSIQFMKRRHHTVPRLYLSGFTDDRDLLWRTPLKDPTAAHLISVGDATVRKDFYLMENWDGVLDDWAEDKLSQFESESAVGFRAILEEKQWPISINTRMRVALWAALQFIRDLATRNLLNETMDQMVKLEIAVQGREGMRRALHEELDRVPSNDEVEESWKQMTDFASYKIRASNNNAHLEQMFKELPGISRTFLARSWTLVRFQRKTLLSSDTPICLLRGVDEAGWVGVGLLTAAHILVPLDRRTGLVMGDVPHDIESAGYGSEDALLPASSLLSRWFNESIIENARQEIFCHPDDKHLVARPLPKPRDFELSKIDLQPWINND
jgi:hypothetical protein